MISVTGTTSASMVDKVTSDGFKTNTRSNCLFSELHIKLTCCNHGQIKV